MALGGYGVMVAATDLGSVVLETWGFESLYPHEQINLTWDFLATSVRMR